MKKIQTYLGLLLAGNCLLFVSCYSPRYVYSPSASNVPLLAEQGDTKLAGYYSSNPGETKKITTVGKLNSGRGLDIQGAWAITDHFAIQGAYTKRWEKNYADYNVNRDDSSLITYSRNGIEFGLGYFTHIDRRHSSFFQVFGGAGFGRSSFTDKYFTGNLATRYFEMDVRKLYIQPAIQIRHGEAFASSLSSRVSFIFFRNVKSNYTSEELDKYQLDDLSDGTKIFWEPAFINAFGLNKLPGLKLEVQLGITFLMSQRFVDYRTFNLSAGIMLDIPRFFEKKSRRKN